MAAVTWRQLNWQIVKYCWLISMISQSSLHKLFHVFQFSAGNSFVYHFFLFGLFLFQMMWHKINCYHDNHQSSSPLWCKSRNHSHDNWIMPGTGHKAWPWDDLNKNIYVHCISRGNRPSIQSIQSESNPDLLRSSPWALHVASHGQEGTIYQNIEAYQIRG